MLKNEKKYICNECGHASTAAKECPNCYTVGQMEAWSFGSHHVDQLYPIALEMAARQAQDEAQKNGVILLNNPDYYLDQAADRLTEMEKSGN